MDWGKYPNFSEAEFTCKCGCGQTLMDEGFMDWLQGFRDIHRQPMKVTSGYRCPKHPVEAKKTRPGAHAAGRAVDVEILSGEQGFALLKLALSLGVQGIGFKLSGPSRFLHLDLMEPRPDAPRPTIWEY